MFFTGGIFYNQKIIEKLFNIIQFQIGDAFGVFCLVSTITELRLEVSCFSCFKTRDAREKN